MTEFTKDDIEYYRKQYALWTSRSQTTPEELHLIGRLRDALDEIERLQKENKELKEFVDATRPTGICEICTSNVISRYEPLQARVQELEQERLWIPVSDRKPELDKNSNEDGTINVLVYIKNYKRILDATYHPKMAVWNMPYGWGDETDNITHWMLKPQPPQDGE